MAELRQTEDGLFRPYLFVPVPRPIAADLFEPLPGNALIWVIAIGVSVVVTKAILDPIFGAPILPAFAQMFLIMLALPVVVIAGVACGLSYLVANTTLASIGFPAAPVFHIYVAYAVAYVALLPYVKWLLEGVVAAFLPRPKRTRNWPNEYSF